MSNLRKTLAVGIGVILIGCLALFYSTNRTNPTSNSSDLNNGEIAPITTVEKPKLQEESGQLSRTSVERELGRKFTTEEIDLKPPDVPWDSWGYFVGSHNLSAKDNGAIEFYGRVVSEDGHPLSGVRLTAKIGSSETSLVKRLATGSEYNIDNVQVVTNQDGEFEVAGVTGRRLTITGFSKPGYEIKGEIEIKGMAPRKAWSYSFIANSPSSFQADPENPEVFTMRKVE